MKTQSQIISDAIRSMTPAESNELGEILASFGVFGSRFHETQYSRRAARNKPPKRNPAMSTGTVTRAQFNNLKAKADALEATLAAKQSELRVSQAASSIRFSEEKHGLTGPELAAIREPKAAEAIEEYASNHYDLRRHGLTLGQYVRSAISDIANAPMPPELSSACDKLQAKYGAVASLIGGGLIAV